MMACLFIVSAKLPLQCREGKVNRDATARTIYLVSPFILEIHRHAFSFSSNKCRSSESVVVLLEQVLA